MVIEEGTDARIEFELNRQMPSDVDLEPVNSEDEDYESSPAHYKIATYPADFTLEVLHLKWLAEDFRIPEFQRGFIWKQVQASKLIESFLVGLPVPPVFVYTERDSQYFLVIDGQQRLKSIFYFFEGFFGEETMGRKSVFRLTGLNEKSRFFGKTYQDLREEDQRRFKNAVLRSFVVQQLDPDDDTSMYHIFERLNTGGTLLTNQEVRNCVYDGDFVKFLTSLNELEEWRKILGKANRDSRKKDIELLVRFFAMRDLTAYQKPMKEFLSKFMRKNKDISEGTSMHNREVFSKTCTLLLGSLGEKPFHIRSGLNTAVYDAVMVAFSQHLGDIPEDIEGRYRQLLQDDKFDKNTREGTTDVDTVRQRFAKAESILFG